jgi:trimeric autotransporter adhesin
MRDFGNTNAAPYASAPAVGLTGDTYWNTTEQALYVSNGTAWVKAGPGAGGPPTGTAGGSLAGTYPNPTLAASGVTAGTYGDQYNVAKVTVNTEGRVTAVVQVLIRARWG